jgi:uncharacterized membrane protein YeaQ/YmgE (transglycosylase-associated protein family)
MSAAATGRSIISTGFTERLQAGRTLRPRPLPPRLYDLVSAPFDIYGCKIKRGEETMGAEIGWIGAIIVGGLAGWLAEMFMKSGTGIFLNIVLGIVGAAVANFLLGFFGIALGGWIGYLIAGFIGACILIFLWRAIKGRT